MSGDDYLKIGTTFHALSQARNGYCSIASISVFTGYPYQVCSVCGYSLEGDVSERCSLCGAPRKKFTTFQ